MRWIKSFFLLFSTSVYAFSYDLSVCAIFQDEAPFLREWIEYHLIVGVEHFYLFNDRSSDEYRDVLDPYIKKGIVELYDCHALQGQRHFHNQRRAYVRGLNIAKNQTRWLAIIDIDEFIVPKNRDSLRVLLQDYTEFSTVAIRWQKFGTSNFWEIPEGKLMIETLVRKSDPGYEDNWIEKNIVQINKLPDYFFDEEYVLSSGLDVVHFCKWEQKEMGKMTNLGPLFLSEDLSCQLDLDLCQINHYWCRNEKYYREKKVPRKEMLHKQDFENAKNWDNTRIEKYLQLYNFCEDFAILRFTSQLRKNMGL